MSVLYKALEKAARQNARGEPGAAADAHARGGGAPPPLTPPHVAGGDAADRPGRGRFVVRVLGLVFLLISAVALAGLVLFDKEVESLLAQALGDPPAASVQSVTRPAVTSQPADTSPALPVSQPAPPPATPAELPVETPAVSAPLQAEKPDEPALPAEPPAPAPEEVEDNIAALMAEGAARRGTPQPAETPASPAAERTAVAAPAPRTTEDALRLRRGIAAAEATGAPVAVVVDQEKAPPIAGVTVTTLARDTRDTLAGGFDALVRGNYAAALNAYDAVLAQDPGSVSALSGRAAALHKLGMTMEARAAYQQVLAREPDNREALTNMIALIGDADPAGALSELERLQTVAPDFSPIPAQMGMLLARQGRTGEALGALRRAVALSPENALYHYNMAVVSDRAGRTADAARSYERVLRLLDGGSAPGGLRAQPIRDRLRYLRARL